MSIYIDWYEWTENVLVTFAERLKNEIDNDSTISAYSPEVIIVTDEDISRFGANVHLGTSMFIIHSLREGESTLISQGREDKPLIATITAVSRSAKPFDRTNNKEINLIGDGTASRPGVIEMQDDIHSLFFNNGALNLLASGGENYLWDIEIGPTDEPFADSDEMSEILSQDRDIIGHKALNLWS